MKSHPAVNAARLLVLLSLCSAVTAGPSGPVAHWTFDDGTGRNAVDDGTAVELDPAHIYRLGEAQACLQLRRDLPQVRIPASTDSPLAIRQGTILFWLSNSGKHRTILEYDNGAIQLNNYRGCFQVRFGGEKDFRYWTLVLDENWPKYDLREFAFYPHVKASVGDAEWHLFAVAYDPARKRIVGWRDGELISTVDLSAVPMEPLKQEGLTEIVTGEGLIGFLDDLRIYDRVLDGDEIREIYERTRSVYAGRRDVHATDGGMEIYRYAEEDRTLYRAWLQHDPLGAKQMPPVLRRISAEGSNSTVHTAAGELASAVGSLYGSRPPIASEPASAARLVLGTAETSSWIRSNARALGLDRVQSDGFLLRALDDGPDRVVVVAGRVPAGVIFGAFDLIRRLQLGEDPSTFDVVDNPTVPLRMVNHWSYFRGLLGDRWRGGGRDRSIYSWEELRSGDTRLIRDWVRLLASAGWNAICPSEVNWHYRDNYLEHLDEVETLAGILRDYGMKLYWSPSYLLALEQETAEQLYARVPDFGGYMMKLGSEKQNGDPRPAMVNRIADTVHRYGGKVLVRGFVYGNFRYTPEPYRNLIPHDLFAREDGRFRDNVVIIPKGSPLDWDFSAPIPALDGAIQKNLSGSEQVIDKRFTSSWIEKWKWWFEQDHYHKGPGSLNKYDVDCIVGVSMISPSPAWTASPLNMVNYYGLGRLAWNPDRTVADIYSEWITQTFGADPAVLDTVKTILFLSDDVTRKLYNYRGYRGMWIDAGDDEDLIQNKTTHTINPTGMGPKTPELAARTLTQYSTGLRKIYGDRTRSEEFLSSFHFLPHDYRLTLGRTLIEDFYENMSEAVQIAEQLPELWKRLEKKVDAHRFAFTLKNLEDFARNAIGERRDLWESFGKITGTDGSEVTAALTVEGLAKRDVFNIRHFGARGDATRDDGPSLQAAVEACHAAGGGTVFVPTGIYRSTPVELRSKVTLVLDKGATLEPFPRAGKQTALLRAADLNDVAIYGPGTLASVLELQRCSDLSIRNLHIDAAGDGIRAFRCRGLVLDNTIVRASRDSLVLVDCEAVEIACCRFRAVRSTASGSPIGGGSAIVLQSDSPQTGVPPSALRDSFLESWDDPLHFGRRALSNLRLENVRTIQRGGFPLEAAEGTR